MSHMSGVVRIKASLQDVGESARLILKRFGGVIGDTISRDFIVPDDMPLWALYYTLTTAFGFLNEHLHVFSLTDEDRIRLTDDKAMKWIELVGILFRTPFMEEGDEFWCDDYRSGSFKAWRRKKYTGPYLYRGRCETYAYSRESVKNIHPDDVYYAVTHKGVSGDFSFTSIIDGAYFTPDNTPSDSTVRKLHFEDLSMEDLGRCFERNPNSLLETLTVREIMERYADKLLYEYDFGDSWRFLLEFSEDECSKEARRQCVDLHRPVMLHADGINLVEDAGGVSGFVSFLLSLYGSPRDKAEYEGTRNYMDYPDDFEDTGYNQYESRDEALDWAYSLEWKEKNPSLSSWF